MCERPSLGVLWQTEAQVDDRQAGELLPQVKHLGVLEVVQIDTSGDFLTVLLVLGQTEAQAAVAVAGVAAHRVHASAVTHVELALVNVCNDRTAGESG